jgi:hypothetical protein
MAALMDVIWPKREAIYFRAKDWTGSISLNGFGKFADWRKAGSALTTNSSFRDGA